MGKLIYAAIASLDGYVADENGDFSWSAPDEVMHREVNELERPIGTYLYGRRMYEVMTYWQDADMSDEPEVLKDYQEIWRAADKVVFSTTITGPATPRTRIERDFDADRLRELKATAGHDLSIGGPEIAAHALAAGLVDEVQLFLTPIIVGGGKQALPDGVRIRLELLGERRFPSGVVHVRYGVTS